VPADSPPPATRASRHSASLPSLSDSGATRHAGQVAPTARPFVVVSVLSVGRPPKSSFVFNLPQPYWARETGERRVTAAGPSLVSTSLPQPPSPLPVECAPAATHAVVTRCSRVLVLRFRSTSTPPPDLRRKDLSRPFAI
jgi:hypothetical protein